MIVVVFYAPCADLVVFGSVILIRYINLWINEAVIHVLDSEILDKMIIKVFYVLHSIYAVSTQYLHTQ